MFDHHFFGGAADYQIALLSMAAAAKAPRRRASRMSARLAAIMAAILLATTIALAGYVIRMELTGLRTEGQVVTIRVDADGPGREPTYYPVIEFATASGALLRFEDFGGSSPRYWVGDRVTVRYRSEETSRFAIVDRDRGSNLLLPLLPFCGALWFGWSFVRRMRQRRGSSTSGRAVPRTAAGAARPQRRMMNV
ncbi:hypothetical protein SSBR45G_43310 [Bradyrhizobium sp. SSBR45G]|uniref:DUF3592 domain-containing protein n=1 Tax=unclassified Bradyrhizobium TaxID=2631580 RepID=UPI002342A0DA|nr:MULTISPECIES: DUF3592 domain-containing protein [unclassified Bradyrhizobium]GLH79422.1 hypothetical protein SSBR45G_43310 [Bradyrhizobium sp. SSBR45G]GLH86799.1 hypothetical protein SSBR45R_42590 [Bradyrhizobium sp. SSBR45R]